MESPKPNPSSALKPKSSLAPKQKPSPPPEIKISQFGFLRAEYRFPCYIKRGDDYEIEITFFRRQRAAGLQAMIYVNLPLRRCRAENGEPLIGRCATKKEIALFRVCRENARLAIDLIEAFACASRTHRADLRREITCL